MSTPSSRTVFLNDIFLPEDEARVSVFDRGFLMADAVYEYTAVIDGKLIDFDGHLDRLKRSLAELSIGYAVDRDALLAVHRKLIGRNAIDVGGVYLQISRGVADRGFLFPDDVRPTVLAFTQDLNFLENPLNDRGLKVISVEDGRWTRRDIKTVQLLYTSMMKTQAHQQGADDAFFVQDGFVTEATSANAFIVEGNVLRTRALSQDLLHGVTRRSVLKLAERCGLEVREDAFTIEEAQNADEAFITASPLFVLGVVEIDGKTVGHGRPGNITRQLRSEFLQEAKASAI